MAGTGGSEESQAEVEPLGSYIAEAQLEILTSHGWTVADVAAFGGNGRIALGAREHELISLPVASRADVVPALFRRIAALEIGRAS